MHGRAGQRSLVVAQFMALSTLVEGKYGLMNTSQREKK